MAEKQSSGDAINIRKVLEDVCLGILDRADLGKTKPTIKHYPKNTLIEIKRYEAFLRIYIADTVNCSIRLNTVNDLRRIDNFVLYDPAADKSLEILNEDNLLERIRYILEDEIGLGMTFSAVAQIPYAWEAESGVEYYMRDVWLDRWISFWGDKVENE